MGESKKETKHSRNRTDIIGHRTKPLESTEETQEFQECSSESLSLIYVLSFYLGTKSECIVANSRESPQSTETEGKKMFVPNKSFLKGEIDIFIYNYMKQVFKFGLLNYLIRAKI